MTASVGPYCFLLWLDQLRRDPSIEIALVESQQLSGPEKAEAAKSENQSVTNLLRLPYWNILRFSVFRYQISN